LVLIVALLSSIGGAAAASHHCAGAAADAMAQLGITPAQIKRTVFIDVIEGTRNSTTVVGYEAWVDLNSCQGTVVAKMSLQCDVEEIYSRGECKISNLKNDH
jgi:hypothetical protein